MAQYYLSELVCFNGHSFISRKTGKTVDVSLLGQIHFLNIVVMLPACVRDALPGR